MVWNVNRTRLIQIGDQSIKAQLPVSPGQEDKDTPLATFNLRLSNNNLKNRLMRELLELPLQNDLTKVPEAKVPQLLIRTTRRTQLVLAFRSLEPGHIASVMQVSHELVKNVQERANLRLIRCPL